MQEHANLGTSEASAAAVVGRSFFAAQDRLRGGPDPALCAPGYTLSINGGPAMDVTAHEQFAAAFYAAFPDLRHEIVQSVAGDHTAVVHFVLHGTQAGSFMGIPASGSQVSVHGVALMRVENGRVVQATGVFDQLSLLQQIGAVPSPEAATVIRTA